MVQTVDQYMLCHRAVRELFLEQLRLRTVQRSGRKAGSQAARKADRQTEKYKAEKDRRKEIQTGSGEGIWIFRIRVVLMKNGQKDRNIDRK